MSIYRNLIVLGICVFFVSCNQVNEKEQEFDQLMQEVINVHDEVMPKMGTISSLIKKLEIKIADTTQTDVAFEKAQQDLKDSHDFMMNWMADFSDKFPSEEEITVKDEDFEQKLNMLKEEKDEVQQLKEQINSSIKQAESLVN